ncbi:MAG: NAD(P)-dependent alcohol dehydrogenase [Porticoccaceae bacterium]|nr:NAD(P)-dependent alcohol dehydrogenase [Porticoccaceae bacterium]
MKAVSIHLPAQLSALKIQDIAKPIVRPGTVKVRWRAAALNYHDYAVCSGLLPTEDGRIICSDAAGEIVEVGEGVVGWQPGDRAISTFFPDWHGGKPQSTNTSRISGDSCDGYAIEFSVVRPEEITRMPRGYSFAEAATLPCAALTAWRALFEIGRIQPGDKVLVQGTGGVSIFALQLAKAAGATVYGTSSSNEKMASLRDLGADHVINYRTDAQWGETIYSLSKGGVDHILEVGGGLTHSIHAGKIGSNLYIIGFLGGMDCSINLAQLMLKQQHLYPIAVGNRDMQIRMVEFLEENPIKPLIDRRFPMSDIAEAFAYQLSGKHVGKVVLDI